MSETHTKTNGQAVRNTSAAPGPSADLEDELRPEYDASMLKNGVRDKHLAAYRSGTNLALLAPMSPKPSQ